MKVVDLPETNIILEPQSPFPFDDSLFSGCAAIVFVVDITDDYLVALTKLCALAVRTRYAERDIPIEVLLHKADAMDEQERQDVLNDVTQKVREELAEICDQPPTINFHLTSIFDSTLYVCLGRIIQSHIPEAPALEALLDIFCNNSKIEKAFLFDTARKLYVAADSSPFGVRSFELASQTLDMICDLHSIYHHQPHKRRSADEMAPAHGSLSLSNGIFIGYAQVNTTLSLLYLLNGEGHPGKPEQLAHNVAITREAVLKVLDASVGKLLQKV